MMAPRRNSSIPKPRATKKKVQLPSPIPDLFTVAILELRRRAPDRFPTNHLSWTSEQLHLFVEAAWENAGPDRQEYYLRAADGLAVEKQSQSAVTEPTANDVHPSPCQSSRAKGRKAPTKSRAKRTALPPPPDMQVHPATPPLENHLESTLPLTPSSTSSSISIPLNEVVRSRDPPPFRLGGAPQPQHPDRALPPYMSPFPTVDFQRDNGAASSEPHPPFHFAPPGYISSPPTLAIGLAPSTAGHTGTPPGIPGSMSGGGIPAPGIDPSLLDAQRQARDQMCRYYPPMHPSLRYAHMSSAVGHWPWG